MTIAAATAPPRWTRRSTCWMPSAESAQGCRRPNWRRGSACRAPRCTGCSGRWSARGLLRRDPERRVYCLGIRCFEYAAPAYAMPDLVGRRRLELRTLRDLTGETTYLAVLDGHEVLSLERCDGRTAMRSRLRSANASRCTARARARRSCPRCRRSARSAGRGADAERGTPRTITDRRRLQRGTAASRPRAAIDRRRGDRARRALLRRADRRWAGPGARRDQHCGPAFRLTMQRSSCSARRSHRRRDASARSSMRPRRVRRRARFACWMVRGRSTARSRAGRQRAASCCGPTRSAPPCMRTTACATACSRSSTRRSRRCCCTPTARSWRRPTAGRSSTRSARARCACRSVACARRRCATTAACGLARATASAGASAHSAPTARSRAAGT